MNDVKLHLMLVIKVAQFVLVCILPKIFQLSSKFVICHGQNNEEWHTQVSRGGERFCSPIVFNWLSLGFFTLITY